MDTFYLVSKFDMSKGEYQKLFVTNDPMKIKESVELPQYTIYPDTIEEIKKTIKESQERDKEELNSFNWIKCGQPFYDFLFNYKFEIIPYK